MPYIGKSTDGMGVRSRFIYTASGSETSKTGADDNGATLSFTDGAYVDVYLNGVLLKPATDYNTSTANTIAGLSALAASDILEVIVYDVFTVGDMVSATSGGTFVGAVEFSGGITSALTPSSADGAALGSASKEWSDLYLADSGVIYFGNDQEITLTHSADDGLVLKHVGTGDGKEPSLTFQAGDNDIAQDDVLGGIYFQAPDETTGTDAITVAARIEAVAETDFSSSVNKTSLVFKTAESGVADFSMAKLTSGGDWHLLNDGPSIFFGTGSDIELRHVHNDGLILKNTNTGDGAAPSFTFQAGDTDIAADDILGEINFQAPDEGAGTDAILEAASIRAVAEGDFSSSSNATSLHFLTGASEAATEKMRLDSHGRLGLNGSSMSSFLSDQFVIQTDDQNAGITVYNTNTAHTGGIVFGDSTSGTARYAGYVQYDHNADDMYFGVETNVIVYFSNSAGHQFYTNTSNQAMNMYNTHNTFTGTLMTLRGNTSNSTDYWYMQGNSDTDGTPDRDWRIDGTGDIFTDAGALNTGGGDYGEMFEWKDGNADDEDRRGITVVLDGNQIKKATSDDDTSKIIGVVSAFPCVIGDNPDSWHGKKLKDDWGNRIKENYTRTEWEEDVVNRFGDTVKETKSYATDCIPKDVTVPDDAKVVSKGDNDVPLTRFKKNPDYDVSKEYINRRDRKEWDVIGLVGKLRIKKGQPTGDRWIKMRDISDDIEEWLVR